MQAKLTQIFEKKKQNIYEVLQEIWRGQCLLYQTLFMLQTLPDLVAEFPAGHLAGLQGFRKLSTRNGWRTTNTERNFKSRRQRDPATVKNGVGRCRLVMFAAGTPACVWTPAFAPVVIFTLSAPVSG